MRIITGQFKGRQIKTPGSIRPTEDRIRKALFDIIGTENTAFLELFAGSGAVGFEALSQGAASVTFVEKERVCARVIEENARELGVQVEIIAAAAETIIPFLSKHRRRFGLIFLDPPYYNGVSEKTLQLLGAYDILLPSGMIIVQHFRKDALSEKAGELVAFRQARYGDSLLSFYQKSPPNVQKSHIPGDV
jgi:16S rRNA (guanine966-N2)-methyltransferase